MGLEKPLYKTATRDYLGPFEKTLLINLFSYIFLPFWRIDVAGNIVFVLKSPWTDTEVNEQWSFATTDFNFELEIYL